MAITKAQQYKQMLRDGGVTEDIGFSIVKPSKDGSRPGYFSGQYGGGAGDRGGNPGASREENERAGRTDSGNRERAEERRRQQSQTNLPKSTKPKAPPGRDPKTFELFKPKDKPDIIKPKSKPPKKTDFRDLFRGIFPTTTSVVNAINQSGIVRNLNAAQRQAYLDSLDLTDEDDKEEYDRIMNQLGGLGMDIIAGPTDLKNTKLSAPPSTLATNPMTKFKTVDNVSSLGDPGVKDVLGEKYDKYLNRFEKPEGREGPDNQIILPIAPTTTGSTTSDEDVDEINRGLAARFAVSIFDFSGLADGGRVPAMGGGIMNTDVIGGLADGSMDQMGRQMYGLGKLVKSVTRGIKKVAKSPLGKAALIGGLGIFGGGGFSVLKNKGLGALASNFFSTKNPLLFDAAGKLSMAKLAGVSALAPLLFQQEEEEEQDPYRGPSIDIPRIRNNPYAFMAPRFEGSQFAADGGRIGYDTAGAVMSEEDMKKLAKSPLYKGFKMMYGVDPQQAKENPSYEGKFDLFKKMYDKKFQKGGDVEPVAKKTMPLLDMGGKEMDLRDNGGFVPIGRMEKADDVPARLSKNEFVFTADAVRNAGDGDVDKGAEVMYNMMKNLEDGGDVSEESQGLEGARNMFQTAQRLEEVL